MYAIKQRIYKYFDKTQKSHLCSFLRSFVKQSLDDDTEKVLTKFLEDQDYYLKINNSRFEFLKDFIGDEVFIAETKQFIGACRKYYQEKEKYKPLVEKQKEFEKQKRRFLQEVKMSKQAPTKKQIYYYDKLCKRYNIDKKDVELLSRLDMKNEIERILDEHSGYCADIN